MFRGCIQCNVAIVVVYSLLHTKNLQIGENTLGKTPNLQKRNLWYYQSEKVFCT